MILMMNIVMKDYFGALLYEAENTAVAHFTNMI